MNVGDDDELRLDRTERAHTATIRSTIPGAGIMAEPPDVALLSNASAICRSCGLCCNGAVSLAGALRPAEVSRARRCGLDVCETTKVPVFRLPCPQFRDHQCAVYDDPDRPQTCRGYWCWVLQRYVDGRLTARSAQKLVRLALAFNAAVAARIGPKRATGIIRLAKAVVKMKGRRVDDPSGSERSSFAGYVADIQGACDESGGVSADLVWNILRAGGFLQRHFMWPEAARKKTAPPPPTTL